MNEGALKAVRELLAKSQIADLSTARQDDVVVLAHNQTVGEALLILAKNKILSAPLVISPGLEDLESLTTGDPSPSLIGWVDIKDIVTAFVRHLEKGSAPLPHSMLALMKMIESEQASFTRKMLITLQEGSEDRALVYQADSDKSVLASIRELFLDQGGSGRVVHRLAIFSATGDITRVVSQLDVIRFLSKHESQLGELAQATVDQLELLQLPGKRPLLTLQPHIPTIVAFERMTAAGVTGAAVTSEQGEMVANLSVSDARGIQPDHLSVLALPVAEFMALSHGTSYMGYAAHDSKSADHPFFAASPRGARSPGAPVWEAEAQDEPVKVVCCTRQSTFEEVVRKLADNDIHRVYVVDGEEGQGGHRKPLGVITPTDILQLVSGVAGDVGGPLARSGSLNKRGHQQAAGGQPRQQHAPSEEPAATADAALEKKVKV